MNEKETTHNTQTSSIAISLHMMTLDWKLICSYSLLMKPGIRNWLIGFWLILN